MVYRPFSYLSAMSHLPFTLGGTSALLAWQYGAYTVGRFGGAGRSSAGARRDAWPTLSGRWRWCFWGGLASR